MTTTDLQQLKGALKNECGNGLRAHHLLHLHAADLIRMAESAQKWREVADGLRRALFDHGSADKSLAAYNELVKKES